jgi:hypothetical protein
MTLNREVFLNDPTQTALPNDGVAKVGVPETSEQWDVLRYELQSFVCEGEYERGLERILGTFLANLQKPTQPAVWVSGFYGSGKSHLVRVLEYLWRDTELPDGASARGLVRLTSEIETHLRELETQGRREGGLWAAAGNLAAGAGDNVRLTLLGIVFRAAGLPSEYQAARLAIYLKQNGYLDAVTAHVQSQGRVLGREFRNMWVSPVLHTALAAVAPEVADTPRAWGDVLRAQYPRRIEDISDSEMLDTLQEVLELVSTRPGSIPLTLLVFDELQQFIGDDGDRTQKVQNVVESCSSRFGSRVLFVATGQNEMTATTQLSKLQGRFTVRVPLSDKDVETVVREVVLRKDPGKEPLLRSVLERASGEIDRQLAGTAIAAGQADHDDLVPEYPLLPVRRRFWERTLRAVDTGAAGQLRTQLRIVHEATRQVANRPVGTVIPGDMIYAQLEAPMQQSGVLLREVVQAIHAENDGTAEGGLRSRLLATIFLIGRLPTSGILATGVTATPDALADLLTEGLTAGSAALRHEIPRLLEELASRPIAPIMKLGDEYRLQTRASSEWQGDFRSRYNRILGDDGYIASKRDSALRDALQRAIAGITLTQGQTHTRRSFQPHFGSERPATDNGVVPVWVRDGWSTPVSTVQADARAEGTDSPIVFVFLPRMDAEPLRTAVAGLAAAEETLAARPQSRAPEEIDARKSMEGSRDQERNQRDEIVDRIVNNARVFVGGGSEVPEAMPASIRTAVENALVRLFPRFDMADHPGWHLVVRRAIEGSADALAAVGYTGKPEAFGLCQEVLRWIDVAGKRGADIRKHFLGGSYGWPQDAVDGALLALLSVGVLRASRNGQPLTATQLTQGQIGVTDFYAETEVVPALTRIEIRRFLSDVGLSCEANQEAEVLPRALDLLRQAAHAAGGDPPLPAVPSTARIDELRALGGNRQLLAVHAMRNELLADLKGWQAARALIEQRLPAWQTLQRLLRFAEGLPGTPAIAARVEAIRVNRSLLADVDPVPPLRQELAGLLRAELQTRRSQLLETREHDLAPLKASREWQALSSEDREQILLANGLGAVPELHLSTDDALLASLEDTSLRAWGERIAAVPGHVQAVRSEAIRRTTPTAVRVQPPHATLSSADEVDAYLDALRRDIMACIDDGHPVAI